jgi:carboxypeptidase C (cathepsin A)
MISKKQLYTALAVFCCILTGVSAQAQKPDDHPDASKNPPTIAAETPKPSPADTKEQSSVTQHQITLHGTAIHYTATAGNLVIRDEHNKPYGSVFYVAYTKDDAALATRPVSFLYNGGPGSSTIWLHMGAFGPVRVVTASPEATPPAPFQIVTNEDSLLDTTDLVFIDAVGTGFSKPIGAATEKDFAGVDEDVRAFNRFIVRYITVNKRWNSPKFLIGESYGTTRSAALVNSLQRSGVECNGVVLISSILNYNQHAPGLDNDFINTLPSYAAIAWFHDKLTPKPADLKAFLEQVREYARGPYAEALAKGQNLDAAEEDAVANKLSQMTGLSVAYLKEANLRVSPVRFRKELLRDERLTLGRYDARFEGMDIDAAGEEPGYDPSDTGITGAFVAAFHTYLANDLKYTSDDPYNVMGKDIIRHWDWKHNPTGEEGEGHFWDHQQMPDVAIDLGTAMRQNPHLKVYSANGYFDLATPFFATEFDLSHMELGPGLRNDLVFGYYPSGHMIYLNVDALKQLKGDLVQFYEGAVHP